MHDQKIQSIPESRHRKYLRFHMRRPLNVLWLREEGSADPTQLRQVRSNRDIPILFSLLHQLHAELTNPLPNHQPTGVDRVTTIMIQVPTHPFIHASHILQVTSSTPIGNGRPSAIVLLRLAVDQENSSCCVALISTLTA